MMMAGALPPMPSEETPPTPSPPNGEDCVLLRSFLLSPPQPLRLRCGGGPGFFFQKKTRLRPRARVGGQPPRSDGS